MELERYIKELRDEHARVDKAIKMLEALAVGASIERPGSGHRKARTPEQRSAQSERMRAYWATKKKATKSAK